ncbi:probable E3 ubiquitin-protein ligase RHY1A [Neltuma alba]|uniref:probable E3 ubiquitin-protein ligase RHY1A n=1 Tax=Neltuma alba TaxID=207710 RepID=UPI0010A3FD67|nr:probable E3 ubiquitin-protein ligase RHY1A [Prosopis alba]
MTSASELFYNRRYRLGRASDYLGNDSLPDRYFHLDVNNRRHHHHPHDFSDGETLRRSTPTQRLFHRLSSTERESARLDRWHNRSLSNTSNSAENVSSFRGPRVTGNDRLPVAVVHARARLLQRLSAAPPSRNRQRGRASLDIDDMRHTNFRDEESSESSTTGLAEGFSLTDLTLQMERSQLSHEVNKKPPGLNQEAIDRLHMEVFGNRETQNGRTGIYSTAGLWHMPRNFSGWRQADTLAMWAQIPLCLFGSMGSKMWRLPVL